MSLARPLGRHRLMGGALLLAACSAASPGPHALDNGGRSCSTQGLALTASAAPGHIVTAALIPDGGTDLIIPNGTSVSVFLADGAGGFGSEVVWGNPTETSQLAVGDLNGDGLPDIVSADGYDFGTLSVMLGNGDGTFQTASSMGAGGGSGPLAIADFNGDGVPDVAFSDASDDNGAQLWIYAGTGAGQFAPPTTVPFNADDSTDHADLATAMAAADLNGDGKFDLVVGNAVFLGGGDGTFTPTDYAAGGIGALVVADFDGDGAPDIAAASVITNPDDGTQVPAITFYFGNGDGTLNQGTQVILPGDSVEAQLAAGDLDGDGNLDLVVGGDTVEILYGQGGRTFATPHAELATSPPTLQVGLFQLPGQSTPGLVGGNQGTVTVIDCP